MAIRDDLDSRFTVRSMSLALSNQEPRPDLIVDQFEEVPVNRPFVEIEINDDRLALVQTSERGSPSIPKAEGGKRRTRIFKVPHIETSDLILAESIADVLPFGEDDPEPFETAVENLQDQLRADVDLTKSNLALGAMMGISRDADGTILNNYFEEFGVVPLPAVQFNLSTNGGNLRAQSFRVRTEMWRALKIGQNTQFGTIALAGEEFFEEMLEAKEVMDAFNRYQDNAFARGNQVFEEVPFAGILWRAYRGTAGGDTESGFGVGIKPDEVRFAPIGLPNLYKVFNAPADYTDTRRTLGLPYYARQEPYPNREAEKGRKVTVQANPLFMPTRPKSLMKGVISAR